MYGSVSRGRDMAATSIFSLDGILLIILYQDTSPEETHQNKHQNKKDALVSVRVSCFFFLHRNSHKNTSKYIFNQYLYYHLHPNIFNGNAFIQSFGVNKGDRC